MKPSVTSCLSVLAFALFASAPALATGSGYEASVNAVGACKSALPIYESGMRQRPLAIANESADKSSFINCSMPRQTNSYGTEWISAGIKNMRTEGPVTVSCTAVIGVEGGANDYVVRTLEVAPGAVATLKWTAPSARWQSNTSFQCMLPPGAAVTEIRNRFRHSN